MGWGAYFTWQSLAISVAVVLAVGVLVATGVRVLERLNRRESEATQLQQRIAEALARAPALRGASVLPVAHVPLRGPAVIELTGHVPGAEARAAALRLAEEVAARHCRRYEVIDRLEVGGGLGHARPA